jgi:hypothetical protein
MKEGEMENGQFQRLLQEIRESRLHTDAVAAELRGHTDQVAAELRTGMREATVEVKRHFDVVAEDLRATERLLAEGIAAFDSKVDRLRGDMNAEFAETRAMIKLSYRELDRRLTTLEERA